MNNDTTDTIDKMWEELTSYQPIADKNRHGNTWKTMCEERTEEAVEEALYDASWAAKLLGDAAPRDACVALHWVEQVVEESPDGAAAKVQRVIESLRRAKGEGGTMSTKHTYVVSIDLDGCSESDIILIVSDVPLTDDQIYQALPNPGDMLDIFVQDPYVIEVADASEIAQKARQAYSKMGIEEEPEDDE